MCTVQPKRHAIYVMEEVNSIVGDSMAPVQMDLYQIKNNLQLGGDRYVLQGMRIHVN